MPNQVPNPLQELLNKRLQRMTPGAFPAGAISRLVAEYDAAVPPEATAQPSNQRPSWDEYFMSMAIAASTRATCPRASVGCVLVIDHCNVVSGFNGAARKAAHCTEAGCLMLDGHCIRAAHAEQNALAIAARRGIAVAGSTAYVTHYPCHICAKLLINAGVVKVFYQQTYAPALGEQFFAEAGIEVRKL